MALKIVRNDITKMNTDAIVNTANQYAAVGPGCDCAVYNAAGYDELLAYRMDNIGEVLEGEVFITPGFKLPARYIIHAVSPLYCGGNDNEEEKLRSCYSNSLRLAKENHLKSIAFPLISTGGYGYPKEQGMRIAVDEINAFLLNNEMDISLVVFDSEATKYAKNISNNLAEYIDQNYVWKKQNAEYGESFGQEELSSDDDQNEVSKYLTDTERGDLDERLKHISDTYSQYLLYLIESKGMENADVYKRAIVDKKTFSKIKNNPDYHPQKITALCLCVGAKLNLDETKDLLARAGYALAPCDMTDIIFSYFIEKEHYDIIDIDIQLEEHGLPCIIR